MLSLLDVDARPVIAHRGASARAPENTLAAFALAADEGADAFELDVHVTADDVVVVLHDPTLDRTTNARGAVAEIPFARVREADAGARFRADDGRSFPWRDRSVRVPALHEVLEAFPRMPCIVEIKTSRASAAVHDVLARHGAADRCVLMSFEPRALDPFGSAPWLTGATSAEALALLRAAVARRPSGPVPYRVLSVPPRWHGVPIPLALLARAARRVGCPTHVWVIDNPAHAQRLWRKGIAGIVTNRPRETLAARHALGAEMR